mmetsp:Transcript_8380/g.35015  ORF Transcript_8380/g.35015 Transcript_8380/m.35015 type:complete len:218 (-) Transcript_8380:281-934(-)
MPPGGAKSRRGDLSHLLLDHVRRLLDGGDLLGTLLVERDLELLLERHHDLDGVEGVSAEVDELGVGRDGVEVGAELLGDDGAHLLQGVGARGGEDTEASLGDDHGARLEGGGRASAELHLGGLDDLGGGGDVHYGGHLDVWLCALKVTERVGMARRSADRRPRTNEGAVSGLPGLICLLFFAGKGKGRLTKSRRILSFLYSSFFDSIGLVQARKTVP